MSKELTCNSYGAYIAKSAEVCRVKVTVEVEPQVIFNIVFESRNEEFEIERGKCGP